MKKFYCIALSFAALISLESCNGSSKSNTHSQTDEQSINGECTSGLIEEERPYIDNSLTTGKVPYSCKNVSGSQSTITVKTGASENDVVVIIKTGDTMVRNAYIVGGDSYTFNLPNGNYQVFFYGGKGWNPEKEMPNGDMGGFVANESFSKDEPVTLNHQGLEYELILQQNGNFSTEPSSASEMF